MYYIFYQIDTSHLLLMIGYSLLYSVFFVIWPNTINFASLQRHYGEVVRFLKEIANNARSTHICVTVAHYGLPKTILLLTSLSCVTHTRYAYPIHHFPNAPFPTHDPALTSPQR